jgi:two-component system chemotaxis response regulator CheB
MIRVLIVEDSPVAQEFLAHILASDPEIRVVGTAENGLEAIDFVRQSRPDVITMDIHMPIMDGYEATRKIMETAPTPIVIVSGSSRAKEVDSTFRAMEAGALAVILRPPGIGHPDHDAAARELIKTVKLMSEVKVVRRIPQRKREGMFPGPDAAYAPRTANEIQVAAIGASTGGPPVLQRILSGLPDDLSFPVLVVQHITRGFTEGFSRWLSETSHFPMHVASNGERALPGHGYIAPDDLHMEIRPGPVIALSDHAPEDGLKPSIASLFRSVTKVSGPAAIGVLLTGMGRDGVEELKAMKENGAITIAQDKESSIVHGMPGEAIKIDAAKYVLPPEGIAELIASLSKKKDGGYQ